ncbi:hypothetical protein J2Z35_001479 [Acetoanaerobium pronyense]|uniref:ECF transporter S component n=1 Tax=Acetoanaerobium pronyense TaxID=1482736 RepID=A0ABS4KIT2_9FIRM|nr:hypothetical protein [Acetoanaerobium pronyense]MBP2027682.1 hypothetical protein [Acetoanaerobium pronyense]
MKIPKLSLTFTTFLLGGYLLSFFNIGGSLFSFASLPAIFYTFIASPFESGLLGGLIFLASGLYKGFPEDIIPRILISISVGLGVYLFAFFREKDIKISLLLLSIIPPLLTFFSLFFFYGVDIAATMTKALIFTMVFNGTSAIVIRKAINKKNQKGVFAEWLNSRR